MHHRGNTQSFERIIVFSGCVYTPLSLSLSLSLSLTHTHTHTHTTQHTLNMAIMEHIDKAVPLVEWDVSKSTDDHIYWGSVSLLLCVTHLLLMIASLCLWGYLVIWTPIWLLAVKGSFCTHAGYLALVGSWNALFVWFASWSISCLSLSQDAFGSFPTSSRDRKSATSCLVQRSYYLLEMFITLISCLFSLFPPA